MPGGAPSGVFPKLFILATGAATAATAPDFLSWVADVGVPFSLLVLFLLWARPHVDRYISSREKLIDKLVEKLDQGTICRLPQDHNASGSALPVVAKPDREDP